MTSRGRPTKPESEKAQVVQITIPGKDKAELDQYIQDIGLGGMTKEFYKASLLSSTSAIQYLDFETRVKTLKSQIQQTKERHDRDRAKLEQAIIDLDNDYNQDIQRLESEMAIALATIKSIQRIGDATTDGTTDGALTNAKNGLSEIVQTDKDRIQATIEQKRIASQSTTDAQKLFEYENPHGFLRQLYDLNKKIQDNHTYSRHATHTPEPAILERWNELIETTKGINWDNIPARNIRESVAFLEKEHIKDYSQATIVKELIQSTNNRGTI